MSTKFILVTGGTISGLGKGIATSSLGRLLKTYGNSVTAIKIDPYLNLDSGTLSPYEHGEVFVVSNGETDLDLGSYERFMNISLTANHSITTGKVYYTVITNEREGKYLGKTVQMVPHITNEIINRILTTAKQPVDDEKKIPEICMIELGGTTGDFEGAVFLEALRQIKHKIPDQNFFHIHVGLIPITTEQKTKPIQHSVQKLREYGHFPDMIFCRCKEQIIQKSKEKISLFCMVPESSVISFHDVENVYSLPELLWDHKIIHTIHAKLKIVAPSYSKTLLLESWINKVIKKFDKTVNIGIVGKYIEMKDAYLSVQKALIHSCLHQKVNCKFVWIDCEKEIDQKINKDIDGFIIPGGFGHRGLTGKVRYCQYARENKIPLLGICLGYQAAILEYCQNVLGWNAVSRECNSQREPAQYRFADGSQREYRSAEGTCSVRVNPVGSDLKFVFDYNPPVGDGKKSGEMKIGEYEICLVPNTQISACYNEKDTVSADFVGIITERFRHRYCLKTPIKEIKGLRFSGFDLENNPQIVELPDHPFYVGTQYHPEFTSKPLSPSPLFVGFIQSIKKV